MLEQLHRAMMPDEMVSETVRTGQVSGTAVEAMIAEETRKFIGTLTAQDRAAILVAMRSVPTAKMERLNAELIRSMVQWANKARPDLNARLQQLALPAADRYMREHPPKN
jgi:hypothetical protein